MTWRCSGNLKIGSIFYLLRFRVESWRKKKALQTVAHLLSAGPNLCNQISICSVLSCLSITLQFSFSLPVFEAVVSFLSSLRPHCWNTSLALFLPPSLVRSTAPPPLPDIDLHSRHPPDQPAVVLPWAPPLAALEFYRQLQIHVASLKSCRSFVSTFFSPSLSFFIQ